MKIIYPLLEGGIAVIHSTYQISIEEVALKDVPYSTPYLIIEDSALPSDRSSRAAWEADFSNPHGYGLGPQRYTIQKAQQEIAQSINIDYNTALISQMEAELQ